MKTSILTIDLFLWKYLIPYLNPHIFKSKIISVAAIFYISCFKLPRKFISHYFKGNGQDLNIDSKEIIMKNPLVYDKLISAILETQKPGQFENTLRINQSCVCNPIYRYSVGSFDIFYSFSDELINISTSTKYMFLNNSSRITKYLHNWLFSLKEKGYANDFDVIGNQWTLTYSELLSIKTEDRFRKYGIREIIYI